MQRVKQIFVWVLVLICVVNAGQFVLQAMERAGQQQMAFHQLGDQFRGLEQFVGHQRRIGYFSDKNMDQPMAMAQFEQAQFWLAPIVLDLNNTQYPFVIFDCTSPQAALTKIKELGLNPIKANKNGVILAVNPKAFNL